MCILDRAFIRGVEESKLQSRFCNCRRENKEQFRVSLQGSEFTASLAGWEMEGGICRGIGLSLGADGGAERESFVCGRGCAVHVLSQAQKVRRGR